MYKFTDNAMESGVATCDTDITNDNFMHLKYSEKSDFIVESPNGVLTYSELTVTAAKGLKMALPNGKDDYGYMENKIIQLADTVDLEVIGDNVNANIFINSDMELIIKKRETTDDPANTKSSASDTYLYNSSTNFYYDNTGEKVIVGNLGAISATSKAIVGIAPRGVFRNVEYSDYSNALAQVTNELKASKEEISAARLTLDRLNQGVNLAQKFAAEIASHNSVWHWIKSRIQAGNYEGIHVNDYIEFTLNAGMAGDISIKAQNFRAEIAGIDTYYGYGDTPIGHHIDFITKTVIDSEVKWNPTNNNNGTSITTCPWLASAVYAWLNGINNYNTANAYNKVAHGMNAADKGIYQLLPESLREVIIQKRQILGVRYSDSGLLTYDTTWVWSDMGYLWLPNEVEVYGCMVWSSGHFDNKVYNYESSGAVQYPLFACHGGYNGRVKRMSNGNRSLWWLSSVTGGFSGGACVSASYGSASNYSATKAGICVPVCFRIG